MKILAVDDDLYIRQLLPMIMAEAGWPDVHVASSARDALRTVSDASPAFDCLLLDIQMPEIDGIELCRQMREMTEYRRTPILMLTAMAEKKYVHLAFEAGATDYITKPFDIIELTARLRVASLLVKTQRGESKTSTAGRADQDPGFGKAVDTGDIESTLVGLPNVIRRDALVNYLLQLSRSDISQQQVLAIMVDQFDVLVEQRKADETSLLSQVAVAIEYAMGTQRYLMTYVGHGVFICSCDRPGLLRPEDLETSMQSAILAGDPARMEQQRLEIAISVGHPLRPTPGGSLHFENLLEKAEALARGRSMRKHSTPKRPNIRFLRLPW